MNHSLSNKVVDHNQRILRIKELVARLQLAKSTIYELQSKNRFPKSFKITGGRAAGWLESDINNWIEQRSRGIA